jgi:hypothetical protein
VKYAAAFLGTRRRPSDRGSPASARATGSARPESRVLHLAAQRARRGTSSTSSSVSRRQRLLPGHGLDRVGGGDDLAARLVLELLAEPPNILLIYLPAGPDPTGSDCLESLTGQTASASDLSGSFAAVSVPGSASGFAAMSSYSLPGMSGPVHLPQFREAALLDCRVHHSVLIPRPERRPWGSLQRRSTSTMVSGSLFASTFRILLWSRATPA